MRRIRCGAFSRYSSSYVSSRPWNIRSTGQDTPYADAPQPLGFNATISAPHMHAYCLHHLKDVLKPGKKVLDVGCGSGYFTALVSYPLRNYHTSIVIGIDHIPELVKQSIENCMKISFLKKMINDGNLKFQHGDGLLGCEEFAPFDCIHVGAAVTEVPPKLLEQLNVGGEMVIPIGATETTQMLTVVEKRRNGEIVSNSKIPVSYVPLTSKEKQLVDSEKEK